MLSQRCFRCYYDMIHIDGRERISNMLASAAGQHVCMGHKFGEDKDETRES